MLEAASKAPFVLFVNQKTRASFLDIMARFSALARTHHPSFKSRVVHTDSDPWW
jgi:Ser/Thr protein kinase RdoA (MazF antagonist)